MKHQWLLVGLAVAGLGLPSISSGQKPAPPAFEKGAGKAEVEAAEAELIDENADRPKLVQVQVEFVELSHEALTKLLFLSKPVSSDATELRKQLQEMVSKSEAKVLETQLLTARSGQKATTESIHEFIYPTEYEPPTMDASVGENPEAASKTSSPSPKTYIAPVPTAFETRNLGSTLEVEPTVGDDDKTIDLRFVPEIVYHTGDAVWHEGKDFGGNSFKVTMPDIYCLRMNTAVICISGQYAFVGAISPKNEKGETDMTRKVMIFVKCDVLTVK